MATTIEVKSTFSDKFDLDQCRAGLVYDDPENRYGSHAHYKQLIAQFFGWTASKAQFGGTWHTVASLLANRVRVRLVETSRGDGLAKMAHIVGVPGSRIQLR